MSELLDYLAAMRDKRAYRPSGMAHFHAESRGLIRKVRNKTDITYEITPEGLEAVGPAPVKPVPAAAPTPEETHQVTPEIVNEMIEDGVLETKPEKKAKKKGK